VSLAWVFNSPASKRRCVQLTFEPRDGNFTAGVSKPERKARTFQEKRGLERTYIQFRAVPRLALLLNAMSNDVHSEIAITSQCS